MIFIIFISSDLGAQIFDCKYEGGRYYKVSAVSGLNLRNNPDLESEIVYKLPFDSEVFACDYCECDSITIDNVSGVWRKIHFEDYNGYAFDGFLEANEKIHVMCSDDWQSENPDIPIFEKNATYFGLYEDEDNQSRLRIYHDRDTLNELIPFEYKAIKFSDNNKPKFILTGLDLEEGQIIDGEYYGWKMVYPGESIYFNQSCLYAVGSPVRSNDNGQPISKIEDYKLILREQQQNGDYKEMVIFSGDLQEFGHGTFEGGVRVKWVGDIDGDKKLDALITFSNHYASYEVVLFLSKKAQGSRLFGEVARYEVSSC